MREKNSLDFIKNCIANYEATLKIETWRRPMNVAKFFGPDEHYDSFSPHGWEPPPKQQNGNRIEQEPDLPPFVN